MPSRADHAPLQLLSELHTWYVSLPKTFEPIHLVQKGPTNPSLPSFPSFAVVNASHAPLHVLSSTFIEPSPLLPTNLYALASTASIPNPSYRSKIGHRKIYSTFEVGESLAHLDPNVSISSSSNIAHQQLKEHGKQIMTLEATLGATFNTPSRGLSVYFENSVTLFPSLSSPCVTNTVAQSTRYFSGGKLNGNKFGFLMEEIPRPLLGDPQERYWKGEDSLLRSTLINSMETQIGKPLLYVVTAKDIWDTIQKLYSKC